MKNKISKNFKHILTVLSLVLCVAFSVLLYGCGKSDIPASGGETILPEEPTVPNEPSAPSVTPPEADKPTVSVPVQPIVPQVKKDTLLRCNASSINIRAGGSTSYKVIGSINKGDLLAYTEVEDGWYKVLYKNGYGYVSSSYVTKVEFDKSDASVEKVVSEGKKLMGTPYVFGAQRYHWGNGKLNTNFTVNEFDCSSLMQYIFKLGANVNLDMTSRSQSIQGTAVSKANLKRGDLMFFTNDSRVNNTGVERIGHVGMYLGDNYILHTASDYAVIEQISAKRWSYFINARRFV